MTLGGTLRYALNPAPRSPRCVVFPRFTLLVCHWTDEHMVTAVASAIWISRSRHLVGGRLFVAWCLGRRCVMSLGVVSCRWSCRGNQDLAVGGGSGGLLRSGYRLCEVVAASGCASGLPPLPPLVNDVLDFLCSRVSLCMYVVWVLEWYLSIVYFKRLSLLVTT